ncbi:MAG: glycosyltransferase family 39 protein, partial [Bacteroidota bacterium]
QGIILLLLFSGLTYFLLRAVFQEQYTTARRAIIVLAILLRIFMAGDLFLHDWDERFHAVIAKDIWENPFNPQLYQDQVLTYRSDNWTKTQLWLNKPFLPFWLLGASISVFGPNELGLRLPSILIGVLSVWLTFRIGRVLLDQKTAIVAAFLHAIHGMTLEFCGGLISSDHVDNLFTFLFQLSILSYLRFFQAQRRWWLLVTGLTIGLAFLTKWIMATFILGVVGVVHLLQQEKRRISRSEMALLVFVTTLFIAPYLVYLFVYHPIEASHTFGQFFGRVNSAFEGHGGGPFAYLEDTVIIFGLGTLLAIGHVALNWKDKKGLSATLLLVWALMPPLLLSFLTTKRNTYLEMSAPAFFLLTAVLVVHLSKSANLLWGKRWLNVGLVVLLLGLPVQYSLERITPFRPRLVQPEWRYPLAELQKAQSKQKRKFVLSGEPHFMEAIFYYDLLSYENSLTAGDVAKFKAEGYLVYEWWEGKYLLR